MAYNAPGAYNQYGVAGFDVGNTSGQGAGAAVPAEISGFNWGAFLMSWIWALGNGVVLHALLAFIIPFWNFYLGFKGNELAWQNKRWDSVEHFKKTQRTWAMVGLVILGVSLAFACLAIFVTVIFAGAAASSS